jgi:hypothetical protein
MGEPKDEIAIDKFDILATYTLAKELLDGVAKDEAKVRGMVAAVMGAQARLGTGRKQQGDHGSRKEAAEKKRKSAITAASFDHQVADKMGTFFGKVFLPTMTKLVQAGLSYDAVKGAVGIPSTWGAKISGEQFKERAEKALKERG